MYPVWSGLKPKEAHNIFLAPFLHQRLSKACLKYQTNSISFSTCLKCDAHHVLTLRSQGLCELGTIINFILTDEEIDKKYGIFPGYCWLMTVLDFIALRAQLLDTLA